MVRQRPIVEPLIGAFSCALSYFAFFEILCFLIDLCDARPMIKDSFPLLILDLISGAAIGYLLFKDNQFVVGPRLTFKIIFVAFLVGLIITPIGLLILILIYGMIGPF